MVIANAAHKVFPDPHRITAIGTAQMPREPFRFERFFQTYPIESDFPISRLATARVLHGGAWFVLRGLYQAVRGHGDRFRQRVVNSGIEVGRLLRGQHQRPTHSVREFDLSTECPLSTLSLKNLPLMHYCQQFS